MSSFERPSQLTIYVCDSALAHHKPLCDAIVHRAREAGLAGATVLRGIEGFGRSGDIHTTRILDVSDHLPISIVIVDEDAKLRDFVHHNDDLLHGRLVTLDQLEIFPAATQA